MPRALAPTVAAPTAPTPTMGLFSSKTQKDPSEIAGDLRYSAAQVRALVKRQQKEADDRFARCSEATRLGRKEVAHTEAQAVVAMRNEIAKLIQTEARLMALAQRVVTTGITEQISGHVKQVTEYAGKAKERIGDLTSELANMEAAFKALDRADLAFGVTVDAQQDAPPDEVRLVLDQAAEEAAMAVEEAMPTVPLSHPMAVQSDEAFAKRLLDL